MTKLTNSQLLLLKERPATVPCNGCTACCKHDAVPVEDHEVHLFETEFAFGKHILRKQPNGDCIYLGPDGCRVHDAPPDICKRFDCRVLFLTTDKARRRIRIVENPQMKKVYEAGKRRLDTLEAP